MGVGSLLSAESLTLWVQGLGPGVSLVFSHFLCTLAGVVVVQRVHT